MAALGSLRRVLLSGIISGAVVVLATPSSTLIAESPIPIVTVVPGSPSQALREDAIAGKGTASGRASGRDNNVEGDVFLGPTPAEVEAIIRQFLNAVDLQTLVRDAASGALLETDTRVRDLGAELDLENEALARLFEILGRNDVPPERLAAVLAEIVARHKSLLERVRLLEASEPRAAELRDAAVAAIETADYDRADALLAAAEVIELEAKRQLQEALDQRVRNAAAIDEQGGGDVAGTQLEYGEAAGLGALLYGDVWAGSEASVQFVSRDRFCRSRPEDRLCQQWAESSSLCDRKPDHPVCRDDDDDRCEKRPDHPLCDDGDPPSSS